jgi:hypothetical protein
MRQYKQIHTCIILLVLSFYNLTAQNVTIATDSVAVVHGNELSFLQKDVNNEICSVFMLYTDLKDVSFYSNLGVEKIIYDTTRYIVWFPAKARVLRIAVPGFALYEYSIENDGTPKMFICTLSVPENEQLKQYRNVSTEAISITTIPRSAKIMADRKMLGRTPFSINSTMIRSISDLTISKFGHANYSVGNNSIKLGEGFEITLQRFSSQKQFAALVTTGIITVGAAEPLYGIELAYISKAGLYVSGKTTGNMVSYFLSGGLILSVVMANINFGIGYAKLPHREGPLYIGGTNLADYSSLFFDIGVYLRVFPNLILKTGTSITKNPIDYGYDFSIYDFNIGIGWGINQKK